MNKDKMNVKNLLLCIHQDIPGCLDELILIFKLKRFGNIYSDMNTIMDIKKEPYLDSLNLLASSTLLLTASLSFLLINSLASLNFSIYRSLPS